MNRTGLIVTTSADRIRYGMDVRLPGDTDWLRVAGAEGKGAGRRSITLSVSPGRTWLMADGTAVEVEVRLTGSQAAALVHGSKPSSGGIRGRDKVARLVDVRDLADKGLVVLDTPPGVNTWTAVLTPFGRDAVESMKSPIASTS